MQTKPCILQRVVPRAWLASLGFSVAHLIAAEPPQAEVSPPLPLTAFSAIGSSFADSSHLSTLDWNEEQIEAFITGVRAALHGKSFPYDEAAAQVSAEMGRRLAAKKEAAKQAMLAELTRPGGMELYLKEVRKKLSLQKSESGLLYRVDGGRGGSRPRPGDLVLMTCATTAADGVTPVPQLSATQARVKLTDMVPGLMEGFQMLTVGSKAVFVIPPQLSFGEGNWPEGVDRGLPLMVQVTLHEVIGAEAPAR